MLICNTCNETKSEDELVPRPDRKTKYRNICKSCRNENQRKTYYERKKTNPFIFKHQKLRGAAKYNGLDYDLDPEFLKSIWSGVCPISGEEIYISCRLEDRGDDNSAELDRFIPSKGYVKGNVTWISRKFNRKKLDSSLEELKMLVEWLESHKPASEGFSKIEKPKRAPWNKGIKTPGAGFTSGTENPASRLTEEQVRDILRAYTGERGQIVKLSREYSVSPAAIRKIVKRQTWKHIEI
jgi:hypothetical protein